MWRASVGPAAVPSATAGLGCAFGRGASGAVAARTLRDACAAKNAARSNATLSLSLPWLGGQGALGGPRACHPRPEQQRAPETSYVLLASFRFGV